MLLCIEEEQKPPPELIPRRLPGSPKQQFLYIPHRTPENWTDRGEDPDEWIKMDFGENTTLAANGSSLYNIHKE